MTPRRQQARTLREEAAQYAYDREHPEQVANGDERRGWKYAFSFTKGLRHEEATGLVKNTDDFDTFVRGIDSGDPRDFMDTPTGQDPDDPDKGWVSGLGDDVRWRAWESEGAGLVFDLQGPDAQAVTMPPAPAAGSPEVLGEMAEVYAQALLRDCPLSELRHGASDATVDDILTKLNAVSWFDDAQDMDDSTGRRRTALNRQTAFRGIAPGDTVGPYLSQFMLIGTAGLNGRSATDGLVQYGGQAIDQRVHIAEPVDYLTEWNEWLDVQNGADLRGGEKYDAATRFITTGRDMATYVHYDALYQAYLNACLIMLATNVPFDVGIPFQGDDYVDRQQGFAHFGPPHILTLVTEVATRALKAVRYQKFNIHRRPRPEVMGARYEKAHDLEHLPGLVDGRAELIGTGIGQDILDRNAMTVGTESMLLPMAFPEGSPMHPSYGAGHATVAGACVTILKAFFDHSHVLDVTGAGPNKAYVPNKYGKGLTKVDVHDETGELTKLTVEGELNKLAANISIGRDWAGVHYFSDYWESLKMGEAIAIGILQEHKFCFPENYSMTIPLFEGGSVRV